MRCVPFSFFRVVALAGLCSAFAACGGVGSNQTFVSPIVTDLPAADLGPTPTPTSTGKVDDWVTYAHDQARTGFQAQSTGISVGNVSTLIKRWSVNLGEPIKASPLVANGMVYVFGLLGTTRAMSIATGQTVWQVNVGNDVEMTPALADGMIFVGTHSTPSVFMAIDAKTGATIWSTAVPGAIRAEPVVVNGLVYEGDASGDPPLCNQGAIRAFNELTGSVEMTWHDDPTPDDGGGIWGPISTDGTSLYFGTGNTCSPGVSDANAAVKLSLAGSLHWAHNEANALSDDDFGSSLMLSGKNALGSDKDGMFFAFDAATGIVQWSEQLGVLDGYGPIGSASTDGVMIVDDGGSIQNAYLVQNDPGGLIYGLKSTGQVVWKIQSNAEVRGNIPINNGVAYVSMNDGIFALNEKTGAKLWTYSFGSNDTYASPAIVPSGLYDADSGGNVYAFGLPARN